MHRTYALIVGKFIHMEKQRGREYHIATAMNLITIFWTGKSKKERGKVTNYGYNHRKSIEDK